MVGENEKNDYGSAKIRKIKVLIIFYVKRRPGRVLKLWNNNVKKGCRLCRLTPRVKILCPTARGPRGKPQEIQTDHGKSKRTKLFFFWNFGVRAHSGIRNFSLSRAFQPIPSYAFKVQVVLDTLQRGKFDQTIFWLSTWWSAAAIIWSVNGPKQAFWSADDLKH
jgi:hypothetical protein